MPRQTDHSSTSSHTEDVDANTHRVLTPAAKRALAEAEARRQKRSKADIAGEVGGRDGPDPVRYGDWEKNGIVSDF